MKTIEEIKIELQNDEDYKKGDIHQAILNIGYAWWQANEGKKYADMIDYIKENYGDLFAVSILVGKYNYQVCNGGHNQYIFNGFGSGTGSCNFGYSDDLSLHHKMIAMFEELSLYKKIALGDKFLSIAKRLKKVLIDEEEYKTLDDEYYLIYEQFMENYNNHLKIVYMH